MEQRLKRVRVVEREYLERALRMVSFAPEEPTALGQEYCYAQNFVHRLGGALPREGEGWPAYYLSKMCNLGFYIRIAPNSQM